MNLDNIEIEISCSKCNFYNYIKIKQARLRDVIICRGCKSNIQLDDQMNTIRKSVMDFKRARREFEKTLQHLNIEIKL